MKIITKQYAPALAGLGFIALLCAPVLPAHAQFPGPPPDGHYGGGGQPNRRPPFANGTVTAVDLASGSVTISSPFGGQPEVIQTEATTKILAQVAATLSDLEVGNQIQIQGIPTGISASSVTIGEPPMPHFGGGRGPGGRPGNGGPGKNGGPGGNDTPPVKGHASASGIVTSVKPLTISLGQGISVTLTLAAAAKVTKFTPVLLSSVKVGDRIVSTGQNNDDGTFTAATIGVNIDMPPMGMGGRGGPGGPNGGPGGGGQ